MAENEVTISETQQDNSLVFAADNNDHYENDMTHNDAHLSPQSRLNGTTVLIPGTNDTATQADRTEFDDTQREDHLQLSPLLGNLKTFTPSKYSQGSTFSPIKYAHGLQNTPTELTPSRYSPTNNQQDAPNVYQDTQVILSAPMENPGEVADTMVIDPPQDQQEHGSLTFGADTQIIGQNTNDAADQGSSSPSTARNRLLFSLNPLTNDIGDTQVIKTGSQANDPTQVIQNSSPEWERTQPVTQVVNGYHHTVESSPSRINESEYHEENTTTVMLSPTERDLEPTTQVLNTQEEELLPPAPELEAVDLSCKPVLSSSEKEELSRSYSERQSHNLSIISNDEKDEEVDDVFYEDSLFKHKLGRPNYDSDSEQAVTTQAASNSTQNSGTNRKLVWSQSSSQTPLTGSTDKKPTWSQSSSDLEDISQDVESLDLDVLKRKLSQTTSSVSGTFDDSKEQINVPKKRRVKHIANSQPQACSKVITEEDLNSLNFENLENFQGVWAFFQFRYYPARILEFLDSDHTLVEFYDWCQKEMKNSDLCILDIRIGDSLRTFNTSSEFIVARMTATSDTPFKCIRGFDTLHLLKKGKHNIGSGTEITVSLSSCYMEPDDWALHQLRFQLMHDQVDLSQRDLTYILPILSRFGVGSPMDEGTPPILEHKFRSPRKAKKAGSNLAPTSEELSGVVFFITSMSPDRKRQLTSSIEKHGGHVLDLDMSQIVTLDVSDSYHLRITLQKFTGVKFGAFLSDGYSRSAKYLQALALGWPILADTFVDHAIQEKETLDNWQAFLLPAGHSIYTKNLKSQDVYQFRKNIEDGLDLNDQLSNNSKLMSTSNFLIYRKKQDKQTLNMCDFILHAFGAQTLLAFDSDVHVMSHIKDNSDMYFLVFDNSLKEIEKIYKQKAKSNKLNTIEFGIVDWEWLVQCTISGHMWPPIASGFIST